uniref:Signal peptidase complex catalytic subunit SEC11 n=1 Tax=Quercus lobata TaxID=97700 RepID=A0A7N2L0J6_QUELO
MEWIREGVDSIKSIQLRQTLSQAVNLGLILTSALIIWKGLICITGSESPVVVVLSESMEPGFQRGDILFLHMSKDPLRAGEIVVFNVDGRDIPIVHRVIKVHERQDTGEVYILTKGDNNPKDDRVLYAQGQRWVQRYHVMGRAVGHSFGWLHGIGPHAWELTRWHTLARQMVFISPNTTQELAADGHWTCRFLPYVGWMTIIMTEKPIIKYIIIGALGLLVITSKD